MATNDFNFVPLLERLGLLKEFQAITEQNLIEPTQEINPDLWEIEVGEMNLDQKKIYTLFIIIVTRYNELINEAQKKHPNTPLMQNLYILQNGGEELDRKVQLLQDALIWSLFKTIRALKQWRGEIAVRKGFKVIRIAIPRPKQKNVILNRRRIASPEAKIS